MNWDFIINLLIGSLFLQANALLLARVYYFAVKAKEDPIRAYKRLQENGRHADYRAEQLKMG